MSARPFRLGLIGLGIMGVPLTRRLRSQGWEVTVWNLEPERYELVRSTGAGWADTAADLREASDVVLICVLGDEAVESVADGPRGLSRGRSGAHTIIDLSTTSVEMTKTLANRLAPASWIDSPISGGPAAAEEGKLTLMVGGSADDFGQVKPVLDDIAGNVTLMGPLGAGQTTKVINQAIVGVNYVLMGEILAIAERSGIDAGQLAACLKGGMADSTILQRIFPQVLARDYAEPKGHAKQLGKDLVAVADYTKGKGLELPVVESAIAQYRSYAEAGNGNEDSASVARLYVGDERKR